MERQSAITLVELLFALAVLAIVLATAVPGFTSMVMNIRMTNSVNELIHALHMARQHASATGTPAALCGSNGDRPVCSDSRDWSRGWLLFVNNDEDDPPQVDPGEAVLARVRLDHPLRLYANRDGFALRPLGMRSTNGTLVWCDARGAGDARAVVLSYTGKPRISTSTANGAPLTCPGRQ